VTSSTSNAGLDDTLDDLVSVYMTAHDAEEFIGAAIDSCLAQTHCRLELIIVDDASTDRTVQEVLARDDERVKLIRLTENAGPGVARNAALEVATGGWLAVLDADDVMHRRRLSTLLAWSSANPGHRILVDDSVRWYPHGRDSDDLLGAAVPSAPRFRDVAADEWLRRHLGGKPMFRRELLDAGVRYPDFRAGQDTSFLIQLAATSGDPITWVHQPTYLYRFVEGSLSTRTLRRLDEVERMLLDLRLRPCSDDRIRVAVDMRLAALRDERMLVEVKAAWKSRQLVELSRLVLDGSNWWRLPLLASASVRTRVRRKNVVG